MRIDEFSALPDGQIDDTERTRFACFGFDIASDPSAVTGMINTITITGSRAYVSVTGSRAYVSVTGSKAYIDIEGV